MDTKKVLQTLVKIANNQQKIINKLAQQAGLAEPTGGAADTWADVTPSVQALLARLPSGKGATVSSAKVGGLSGMMDVRVAVHDLNSTAGHDLHKALVGRTLQSTDGKTVNAPDFDKIKVITETV